MASHRAELTPQMLQYAEKFDDRGEIRWLPYLMYFHAAEHHSEVVSTDRLGFRLSEGRGQRASVGGRVPEGPVRLIAGSSSVFGIGASSDAATLASRLWDRHAPGGPWLNFGGRSFNSAQELLLFVLYRHLVPQIEEIVLFSGFNNLGLARLPRWMQGDSGAFFNGHEYFDQVAEARARKHKGAGHPRWPRRRTPERSSAELSVPDLGGQLDLAVDLTVRHLDNWNLLAQGLGARLTFVLQPLAPWVRERPAPQEKLLFDELDGIANFSEAYGDICTIDVGRRYADRLRRGCEKLGIPFHDMNPVLGAAISTTDWIFVDRIHFTDEGHDIVAGLLAEQLALR
ncbi:SGNH/GDSL hydrolase family protein [Streptomyces akebiae]|uniref:SGNH/GDSL hydrolase family protein n=1 Tax=Streptomyces akebiae TaxID=2865673 RepID=A0ABX8XUW8_9ACTN|nr:SGNH/GDSL hydrolase family protein [Streptomyces akebiae]QYX79567.1 SGNH/GDSL hydrolase family protein [Streptomyces akebiae]